MDLKNLIIDRWVNGYALDFNDEILYGIDQLTNPTINQGAESTQAVDAIGIPIHTFYRSKTVTLSAENAILDLDLMAAQFGTEKQSGTTEAPMNMLKFETIDVGTDLDTPIVLKHTPVADIATIYKVNGDSSLGKKYTADVAAGADTFIYTPETHAITLPTDLVAGDQVFVKYEYASQTAFKIVNSAKNFPKASKFVFRVLTADICDPTLLRSVFIVFPNAQLSPEVDLNFTTDGTHAFTIEAQQDYCSKDKELLYIVGDDEE